MRTAELPDAPALTVFERNSFKGYYAPHRFSEHQFRYYLTRPSTISYVMTSGDHVLGYVLGAQGTGRRKHITRLLSIAVDPGARNLGMGRRLLEAFLIEARRRSSHVVSLEVAEPNKAALQLFASEGFKRVSRLPRYYTSAVDGIRMRTALAPVKGPRV
jgi:[ribosomal protein S18]-alanine N-acetyltransferase